jgi:hypothetical protein
LTLLCSCVSFFFQEIWKTFSYFFSPFPYHKIEKPVY